MEITQEFLRDLRFEFKLIKETPHVEFLMRLIVGRRFKELIDASNQQMSK